MVLGEYYEGYITYREHIGASRINLSWNYPGQSTIVIPSTYLYSPTSISSPMQLNIDCPNGYIKYISSGRPSCKTVCKDGLRAGLEECDDNDATNANG